MMVHPRVVAPMLAARHYLGPARASGVAWRDEFGVVVVAPPTSRRLPGDTWIELVRWCIASDRRNAGSLQWAAVRAWIVRTWPEATTVVSYSDPSVGHTGALYRACNWLWAPTWHRLRPPPTANGRWAKGGKLESVKDRWVFPLAPDPTRARLLAVNDDAIMQRLGWCQYSEPVWTRRGTFRPGTGGGDYKRWISLHGETTAAGRDGCENGEVEA